MMPALSLVLVGFFAGAHSRQIAVSISTEEPPEPGQSVLLQAPVRIDRWRHTRIVLLFSLV